MRDSHFERFQPICPSCRSTGTVSPLILAHVERRIADDVIDGSLMCGTCRTEYAIIDGIPIIVGNQRELIAAQLPHINARDDLSPWIETMLLDCSGPGAEFDRIRYSLSTYGRSHWDDHDPARAPVLEGRITHLLDAALALLPAPARGAWLDVGCSVGRSTFELAARTGDLALGVDLSFAALRTARGSRPRAAPATPRARAASSTIAATSRSIIRRGRASTSGCATRPRWRCPTAASPASPA